MAESKRFDRGFRAIARRVLREGTTILPATSSRKPPAAARPKRRKRSRS